MIYYTHWGQVKDNVFLKGPIMLFVITGPMCELMWSDPQMMCGTSDSKRGVGTMFGPDITKKFLQKNKLDYIIRSHEVKQEGYEVSHDGKCITVFSAPNYWYV